MLLKRDSFIKNKTSREGPKIISHVADVKEFK